MTTKSLRSTPLELACPFERGTQYKLSCLGSYLRSLEETRVRDKEFSSAIALSTPRSVRAVFDELYPLHIFARHRGLADATEFEWQSGGRDEKGVDFIVFPDSNELHLQVTVTGPIWNEAIPPLDNPGFQHRLLREQLSTGGIVSGRGPWRRDAGCISGGSEDWTSEQRDDAFRNGLIAAYERKRNHRGQSSELLVRVNEAEDFMEASQFHRVVSETACAAPLRAFQRVHLVDRGEGFYCALP